MSSPALHPNVRAQERELFKTYYPIEMSPTMSKDEKLPYMIEW